MASIIKYRQITQLLSTRIGLGDWLGWMDWPPTTSYPLTKLTHAHKNAFQCREKALTVGKVKKLFCLMEMLVIDKF